MESNAVLDSMDGGFGDNREQLVVKLEKAEDDLKHLSEQAEQLHIQLVDNMLKNELTVEQLQNDIKSGQTSVLHHIAEVDKMRFDINQQQDGNARRLMEISLALNLIENVI